VTTGKGYVGSETKKRIRKIIDETRYVPNKIASSLVKKRGNDIAIVLQDLTNPYYLQAIDAIIAESQKYGYVVSIFKANEKELPDVLQEVVSNRPVGVINYASAFPEPSVKALREIGAKVILKNWHDTDFQMSLEYGDAIFEALRSLAKKGAEKIIFVSGMGKEFTFHDSRARCFLRRMEETGLKADEGDVILGDYPQEKAFVVGYNAGVALMDSGRKIDAAFCMNDMMAFGFINGLKKKGKRAPEDIAVIGFDNIYMSGFFEPTLSTVATDIEREARLYVNYIVGIDSGNDTCIKARFIERDSTGLWSKI
jgi:LacI family transcriptional regulator